MKSHEVIEESRDGLEAVIVGSEFLTVQEVYSLFGYTNTAAFYHAMYEGIFDDLPTYRRGRRYYFKDCEVYEFIESMTAEFRATRAPLRDHIRENERRELDREEV